MICSTLWILLNRKKQRKHGKTKTFLYFLLLIYFNHDLQFCFVLFFGAVANNTYCIEKTYMATLCNSVGLFNSDAKDINIILVRSMYLFCKTILQDCKSTFMSLSNQITSSPQHRSLYYFQVECQRVQNGEKDPIVGL